LAEKLNKEPVQDPHDFYDRMFKRILTLSGKAVIGFINGNFGTSYSENSKITYNWTEFVDDKLKKTLADTIITVNGKDSYHIEAQMYDDEQIVLRMVEYGYKHALRTWECIPIPFEDTKTTRLNFPKQKVIYLNDHGTNDDSEEFISNVPKEYKVQLVFDIDTIVDYSIPVINFQEESINSIKEKNMIILLPFKLIKLRKSIGKARTKENISQLREIYENDIMTTIENSFEAGNITWVDRDILVNLTKRLFKHLYRYYDEFKEMIGMHDESLTLEIDEYLDALEEKINQIEEMDGLIAEKNKIISEQDTLISEKDTIISEKDAEIKRLSAELAKYSNPN